MRTVQAEIERDNSFQRVIGSIWRRTRCARLLLCLVLAGVLAFGPSISGGRQSESRHDAVKRATTKINSKPISDIRVGERVWTAHADAFQDSETHVDPATWKHVVLRAESRWEDGTLDDVNVETLQPPEWIAAHHVTVGATVPLPLDLIEMGLPEDMKAKVLAVAPCVPLKPGPGRVVLTTVNHLNGDVCELTVEDSAGRRETVRPTGAHRFCRALDDQWIHLNEVQPGDSLHGRSGALKVLAIERIPGVHRVYNMTVEREHIYSVSALGVLAHNQECRDNAKILRKNMGLEGRPPGTGEAAGHIVASTGSQAQWASAARSRAILQKYGINVNDAANGIPIGHPRPHNTMHSAGFNQAVEERLNSVVNNMTSMGYGKDAIRGALRRELRQIGQEVLAGTFK